MGLRLSLGLTGGGRPAASLYTGPVADRVSQPQALSTSFKQMMSRSRHIARDGIKSLQIILPNYYLASGVETALGATATITAAIEYNGVATQVLFSGTTSGTIPDGGYILSDAVSVAIPANVEFFVRTYFTSTAGIVYSSGQQDTALGERQAVGVSGISDLTMGTGTAGWGGQVLGVFRPIAILGTTRRGTVGIVGDSKADGFRDQANGGGFGEIARGLSCGTINVASPSDKIQSFVAGHTNRLALLQYCSHIVCQYAINDIYAARTLAQMQADFATFAGYFSAPVKLFVTTCALRTTSTDGFMTVANQTPQNGASETVRVQFNAWVRGVPSGWTACLEIADQVESARDSGKWMAPATIRSVSDGAMTLSSTTLTSATAGFTQADVGYSVFVPGAAAAGGNLVASVVSVTDAQNVVLSLSASTAVTGAAVKIGGITTDGLHETQKGYILASAGVSAQSGRFLR